MDSSTIIQVIMYGLIAWFLYSRLAPIKGLQNLNAEQVSERLKKNGGAFLIDVREPYEYKSGFIPKAVNIPLSQLSRRVKEIPKNTEVILYCRSGMRSKQAAKVLKKQGYSELAHLQGGISAWTGAIHGK